MTYFPCLLADAASEGPLRLFLLQLAVVVLAARASGWIALRVGQPRVVGEILGGLALGPSLLGAFAPGIFGALFGNSDSQPLIFTSQVGLVLFMFQAGMEFEFKHLRERVNQRAVMAISIGSIVLPLALGYATALALYAEFAAPLGIVKFHFCAFVAVAMAITALPILGRIMASLGITKTRMGSVTISSAASNDVVGWILLAAVSTAVAGQFSAGRMAGQVGLLAVLCAVLWLVLRPLLKRLAQKAVDIDGNLSFDYAAGAIVLVLAAGVVTSALGIFAAFGGFAIGVLLAGERRFIKAWSARMEPFVYVFFLPVFFTCTGLRTDAGELDSPVMWLWCLLVIATATAGKWLGAYWAARLAGIPPGEARCIAVMMNTRALMELIVLHAGYELGVIPASVFTMLVIMAVATTLITTPLLRRFLRNIELEGRTLGNETEA
ncbi:MAG: Kef-type K+ transport system membrane component KefB [Verrucomicrobiales bacterium]|jgi:Kef-type K+ transport system membrane component KefB